MKITNNEIYKEYIIAYSKEDYNDRIPSLARSGVKGCPGPKNENKQPVAGTIPATGRLVRCFLTVSKGQSVPYASGVLLYEGSYLILSTNT